jgi:hypothetical protein
MKTLCYVRVLYIKSEPLTVVVMKGSIFGVINTCRLLTRYLLHASVFFASYGGYTFL